jgi:hypothetical protein
VAKDSEEVAAKLASASAKTEARLQEAGDELVEKENMLTYLENEVAEAEKASKAAATAMAKLVEDKVAVQGQLAAAESACAMLKDELAARASESATMGAKLNGVRQALAKHQALLESATMSADQARKRAALAETSRDQSIRSAASKLQASAGLLARTEAAAKAAVAKLANAEKTVVSLEARLAEAVKDGAAKAASIATFTTKAVALEEHVNTLAKENTKLAAEATVAQRRELERVSSLQSETRLRHQRDSLAREVVLTAAAWAVDRVVAQVVHAALGSIRPFKSLATSSAVDLNVDQPLPQPSEATAAATTAIATASATAEATAATATATASAAATAARARAQAARHVFEWTWLSRDDAAAIADKFGPASFEPDSLVVGVSVPASTNTGGGDVSTRGDPDTDGAGGGTTNTDTTTKLSIADARETVALVRAKLLVPIRGEKVLSRKAAAATDGSDYFGTAINSGAIGAQRVRQDGVETKTQHLTPGIVELDVETQQLLRARRKVADSAKAAIATIRKARAQRGVHPAHTTRTWLKGGC